MLSANREGCRPVGMEPDRVISNHQRIVTRWSGASPKQRHRPPHFLTGRHAFFITASTVDRQPYLLDAERRTTFSTLLQAWAEPCALTLAAWVVLKEHYHVVLLPADEREPDPMRWIAGVHAETSHQWNDEDGATGRQVWYQFWDHALDRRGSLEPDQLRALQSGETRICRGATGLPLEQSAVARVRLDRDGGTVSTSTLHSTTESS